MLRFPVDKSRFTWTQTDRLLQVRSGLFSEKTTKKGISVTTKHGKKDTLTQESSGVFQIVSVSFEKPLFDFLKRNPDCKNVTDEARISDKHAHI